MGVFSLLCLLKRLFSCVNFGLHVFHFLLGFDEGRLLLANDRLLVSNILLDSVQISGFLPCTFLRIGQSLFHTFLVSINLFIFPVFGFNFFLLFSDSLFIVIQAEQLKFNLSFCQVILQLLVFLCLLFLQLCLFPLRPDGLFLLVCMLRLLFGCQHFSFIFVIIILQRSRSRDFFKESSPFLRIFHGYALNCSLKHQEVFSFGIDTNFLQLRQIILGRNAIAINLVISRAADDGSRELLLHNAVVHLNLENGRDGGPSGNWLAN